VSSFLGAYFSFYLDGATGGIIVCLQTLIFLAAFFLAPKHGLLASRQKAKTALKQRVSS
jgi:manganese/iron transport system permease protein